MKTRAHKMRNFLFLIVILGVYLILAKSETAQHYLANPETLKIFLLGFGILAPIAIIFLQAFQTTISIIPSQLTTILAGFVFGPFLGVLYSIIGAFLGSAFVFMISRKYGKKLALRFFEKKEIVHFNILFKQKKWVALFLARIAPIFPNDLVSFTAGLTDIKFKNFNIVSTVGFVFQMFILTYFGAELSTGKFSWPLVVVMALVTILVLVLIFKNRIKKVLIKDLYLIEKELEKEFKKL